MQTSSPHGVDPQPIQVTVPAGSLAISTPYTPDNPADFGELRLDGSGSELSGSVPFGDGTVAGSIMITDTRMGGLTWSALVQATDFVGPAGAINAADLGLDELTAIELPGNDLRAADLDLLNQPGPATPLEAGVDSDLGLGGEPHAIARTHRGAPGTIGIRGRLTLVAPTSTLPGSYTSTLTFTVV